MKSSNPRLKKSTLVYITRQVKAFRSQEPDVWGPMKISQAEREGHFSTSSGTVSVSVKVAEGEHKGANVYEQNGVWFAQYDPILQYPDRTNKYND